MQYAKIATDCNLAINCMRKQLFVHAIFSHVWPIFLYIYIYISSYMISDNIATIIITVIIIIWQILRSDTVKLDWCTRAHLLMRWEGSLHSWFIGSLHSFFRISLIRKSFLITLTILNCLVVSLKTSAYLIVLGTSTCWRSLEQVRRCSWQSIAIWHKSHTRLLLC